MSIGIIPVIIQIISIVVSKILYYLVPAGLLIFFIIKNRGLLTKNNKKENTLSLGELIRSYRIKNEMTQENLAEKADVSRQAVAKWERNLSKPSSGKMKLIADALHASLEEFEAATESGINPCEDSKVPAVNLKRHFILNCIMAIIIYVGALFMNITGISGKSFSFEKSPFVWDCIMLGISLAAIMFLTNKKSAENEQSYRTQIKTFDIVSIIIFALTVITIWTIMYLVGIEMPHFFQENPARLGNLLTAILTIATYISAGMMEMAIHRNIAHGKHISLGFNINLSTIYMTAFLGDMLYRFSDKEALFKTYPYETLIMILEIIVLIALDRGIRHVRSRSENKSCS